MDFVDYLRVCHGHCEALHPFLGLRGVFSLQNESLVCSKDFKGLGDVPAALDVDTADAPDIDREDAFLLCLVLVSKASPGEGEVATFPLLEDLPLASLLLLQLTLDNGFFLGDKGRGSLRMGAEETSPLVLGRIVLKHIKKPDSRNYPSNQSYTKFSFPTFPP